MAICLPTAERPRPGFAPSLAARAGFRPLGSARVVLEPAAPSPRSERYTRVRSALAPGPRQGSSMACTWHRDRRACSWPSWARQAWPSYCSGPMRRSYGWGGQPASARAR